MIALYILFLWQLKASVRKKTMQLSLWIKFRMSRYLKISQKLLIKSGILFSYPCFHLGRSLSFSLCDIVFLRSYLDTCKFREKTILNDGSYYWQILDTVLVNYYTKTFKCCILKCQKEKCRKFAYTHIYISIMMTVEAL